MLSVADQLLFTTVKIATFSKGAPHGSGTGFFWRIDDGDRHAILLITNKHVVAGADHLVVMCHRAAGADYTKPSGKLLRLTIEIDGRGLFEHPDPDIDLCALGISDFLTQAQKSGEPIFLRPLVADNVPTESDWDKFDAIEDVLMVGCPRGIYDETNNFPIVRKGITASSLGRRYNGKEEFLVDMACFPGSSGSPVFLHQLGYEDKETGNYMAGARRFFFLGVLYAGPLFTNEGKIILGQQPRVEVAAMMHLGQVIRSTAVLEIEALLRKVLPDAP